MSGQIFWSVLVALLVYSIYEELLAYAKHQIMSRKLDKAMESAFKRWDEFIERETSKKNHPSGRKAKTTVKVNE